MSRTRIVATLGPASAGAETIGRLIDAGVDVFRLNFSHGTRASHGETIDSVRRVAGSRPVAILADLAGPKLRLDAPVHGAPGDVVVVRLPASVEAGDPVLLADGLMQLEVVDAGHARVIVGGAVAAGKGLNLPSSRLDIGSLTAKDLDDLRFVVGRGVDFVGVSFVHRASDLDPARTLAGGTPLIAKIETAQAVEHQEEIVAAADGVMVARGDLGVEIPIERVPVVQKALIARANAAGKPVITATQMLRSMVDSLLPTRAEVTDVANAVLDGTDAVMLSEESAIGRYPVESVAMMRRIVAQAEGMLAPRLGPVGAVVPDMIAHTACEMAARIDARAIVVPTRSGMTARRIARHRPRVPIVALTVDDVVRRRLSLVWGVTAVTVQWADDADFLDHFRAPVRALAVAPAGAPVVVTAGWPITRAGLTNLVHVTTL